MTLFPESFFAILITGALILTGIGALTLLILLVRDFARKKVW
jgi:hypothetical protein